MALSGNQVGGLALYGGIASYTGNYSGKTEQVVANDVTGMLVFQSASPDILIVHASGSDTLVT